MEKKPLIELLDGQAPPAEVELKQKIDSPTLGALLFILSGIAWALNFIFGKLIYESKPQTTPLQLLAYRSIISSAILIIIVNRNLKKVMWDNIPRN